MEQTVTRAMSPNDISFRAPTASDGAQVWELVERTPSLDANSPYAYLLLCSHFADTGLIACRSVEGGGEELVGFVLGYVRPDEGGTAFVWQVAVDERLRGCGLGGRLLDGWFARCARRFDVRILEATVTPSNRASRSAFASFARRHRARLVERVAFPPEVFPDDRPHETELAIRIGPILLSQAFGAAPVVEARRSHSGA